MRNNFRVVRAPEVEVAPMSVEPQPTLRPQQQARRFGTGGSASAAAAAPQAAADTEYDYLDIPAFLRRQAD